MTLSCSDWDLGLDATGGLPEDGWAKARDLIIASKGISDEERALLETSTLKDLQTALSDLQSKHAKESKFRRSASKIHLRDALAGLINLEGAVSAMANSNSIASLVWGSTMIVCRVTTSPLIEGDIHLLRPLHRLYKGF